MDSGTNGGIHGGAACILQDKLMCFIRLTTFHRFIILDNSRKRKRPLADDALGEDSNSM